jgi:inosine-uridine nucleoside N-ribohydrolase
MKQHGNAGQIGRTLDTLEDCPKTRWIASRSGTASAWQLFGFIPLWDELTVGIYLDPTLITNQKEVLLDVDVSHGPGYGSARIYADSVAPRLGERKVNIVIDVDAKRFVNTSIKAMQWEPPK